MKIELEGLSVLWFLSRWSYWNPSHTTNLFCCFVICFIFSDRYFSSFFEL